MMQHTPTRTDPPGPIPRPRLRAAARAAAGLGAFCLLVLAGARRGADAGTFYCESTSKLVSGRVGTLARSHKTWLTPLRMRFDDGDELTTILRLDMGELWIANREKKTFLRRRIEDLMPGVAQIDDGMSRQLGKGVARFAATHDVGGHPCTKRQIDIGRTPCTMWVDESEGSRQAFETVRELAREAQLTMTGRRVLASPVTARFGALQGLPLEITVGDPKRVELTWTITRYSQPEVPKETFALPPGYRESNRADPQTYTLPEHVYYLGEATASYFAPSPERGKRSLLPPGLALGDAKLVQGFYEGDREGLQLAYIHWCRPLSFYLAADLWRFPLSGRAFNLLQVVGKAYVSGGLKSFPYIEILKRPAG